MLKITIKYSKIKHGRVKIQTDGSLVLSIPKRLKNNTKFRDELIEKGKLLLKKRKKRQWKKIEIQWKNTVKIWGEDIPLNMVIKDYLDIEFFNQVESFVDIYCEKLWVKYGKISVKYLKSKWGSCSSSNNLVFNMNLLHLPIKFTEYVVIHEVCHIVHKNHSKKFRDLVSIYCPEYKQIRKEMRKILI